MKIRLQFDEMNRMYIIDEKEWGMPIEVDVPDELVERFKKAEKEFREADEEMYQLFLKAREKERTARGEPI